MVRRWRRCVEELAEEETHAASRAACSDEESERVAGLLAASLLGGQRAAGAEEALEDLLGEEGAQHLHEQCAELLEDCVERVLYGERDLRLVPLETLDAGPEPQMELIAAFPYWTNSTGRTGCTSRSGESCICRRNRNTRHRRRTGLPVRRSRHGRRSRAGRT